MTRHDFNLRLHDQPFRPFRVHLSDGSMIPVMNPGLAFVGESTVLMPTEVGNDPEGFPLVKRWRTVSLSHMVQFSDVDEPATGTRSKKRR